MDNFYNSAQFSKLAYNHPIKIHIHGIKKCNGNGMPTSILQYEIQNRKEQGKVCGKVKVDVLVGGPNFTGLVSVSVYDKNPVYFLSMRCEDIK